MISFGLYNVQHCYAHDTTSESMVWGVCPTTYATLMLIPTPSLEVLHVLQ
jgi:hypothetical protein